VSSIDDPHEDLRQTDRVRDRGIVSVVDHLDRSTDALLSHPLSAFASQEVFEDIEGASFASILFDETDLLERDGDRTRVSVIERLSIRSFHLWPRGQLHCCAFDGSLKLNDFVGCSSERDKVRRRRRRRRERGLDENNIPSSEPVLRAVVRREVTIGELVNDRTRFDTSGLKERSRERRVAHCLV
jgi:hypothetical protein